MNLEAIKNRLAAKAKIRDANQSIREAKQNMKTTPDTEIKGYSGFTDPEERKILKDGGNFRDVEALRKSKAAANAPALLAQMQAGKKPVLNQYEKDAVLALSFNSAPSSRTTPPTAAAPRPSSAAPVSAKPAAVPTVTPVASARPSASKLATAKPSTVKPAARSGGNGAFVPSPIPTMSKAEFDALSNRDKSRFSLQGGKIVEPETAKPHRDASGTLTRAGLAAMSPADRMAHFKAGGKLVD